MHKLNIPTICMALNLARDHIIILDSEIRQISQLGETNIIGIIMPDTDILSYSTGSTHISVKNAHQQETISLESCDNDVFIFLKSFMAKYEINDHYSGPFC